jgi:hypothetical protein
MKLHANRKATPHGMACATQIVQEALPRNETVGGAAELCRVVGRVYTTVVRTLPGRGAGRWIVSGESRWGPPVNRKFVFVLALALFLGCDRKHDGKCLALEWNDPTSKTVFRVTEDPGPIVKQNSRLHVARDGQEQVVLIDDDAVFSTVAFVRYEHWLLVVCRGADEVWAGYDYDSAQLYGEYGWDRLPFTKWSAQGTIVAERRLRADSASPANFPRRGP